MMTADVAPGDLNSPYHVLRRDIEAYVASPPKGHRFISPVVDWHHPDEYSQQGVQGLSKFLSQVTKECNILDELAASTLPTEYSSNLVALQGVWDAFLRATPPLVGIWQVMDRRPGPGGGGGAGGTKVDVVARGGDEWIKVNTIKESRLLIEFREQDSYINSDYDSDSDDGYGGSSTPPLTNTLLSQASALVEAAKAHARLPGLPVPRIKYVLTRLEPSGHSDPRVGQTLDAMRDMGIEVEFASQWGPAPPIPAPGPDPVPATDIVLDLSVLIALCCDSTHHPLPANDAELEARFRARQADGSLAQLHGASRDLRDQLKCEMQRPLIEELRDRLTAANIKPRFWVTREVRERLPTLVDVIGGLAERARARALFYPEAVNFWEGSRWEGKAGCLTDLRVRILEDDDEAPTSFAPDTPFDSLITHVCNAMLAATNESPDPTPRTGSPVPAHPTPIPTTKPTRPRKPKRATESKSPLRPGTVFPPASRLPSGHTLRTLLAGMSRRATVLTNNRGAVLKVMREAGIAEGIPAAEQEGAPYARIWVVNPSSLAEWRRIEVEESNAKLAAKDAEAETETEIKDRTRTV